MGTRATRTKTEPAEPKTEAVKAQPPRAIGDVLADAGGATAEEMEDADEDAGALGAEDDDGGHLRLVSTARGWLARGDGVVFARVRGDRFPRGETTPRDRGDRGGGARAGRRGGAERHRRASRATQRRRSRPRRWPRRDPTRPSSTRRSARAGRRRFVDLPRPSRSPPPSSSRTPRRRSRRGTIRSGPRAGFSKQDESTPPPLRFTGRAPRGGNERGGGGVVGVGDGDRDGDGDDVARVHRRGTGDGGRILAEGPGGRKPVVVEMLPALVRRRRGTGMSSRSIV